MAKVETHYPNVSDTEDSSTESVADSDSESDMDSDSGIQEIDFLIIEACVPGPRTSVSSRSRASATSSRSAPLPRSSQSAPLPFTSTRQSSSQSAPMRSSILQQRQRASKSLPLSIPSLAPGEKWIPYVKSVQAENGLSYSEALKAASSPYREQKAAIEAAASAGGRRRAMYY